MQLIGKYAQSINITLRLSNGINKNPHTFHQMKVFMMQDVHFNYLIVFNIYEIEMLRVSSELIVNHFLMVKFFCIFGKSEKG